MFCSTARRIGTFLRPSLSVVVVMATNHVRDLGVLFRSDLSMCDQIKAVERSYFYEIRQHLEPFLHNTQTRHTDTYIHIRSIR